MTKKIVTLVVYLLIPLSLCALKPVTDSDLSNVSTPASLSTGDDQRKDANAGRLARFMATTRKKTHYLTVHLKEDGSETVEREDATNEFSFSIGSWRKKDNLAEHKEVQNAQDSSKELNDMITVEDERGYGSYVDLGPDKIHTIDFRFGSSGGLYTPVTYETPMRDYYTNDSSYMVQPKSWVNVQTR